jgi:hypothetical protein
MGMKLIKILIKISQLQLSSYYKWLDRFISYFIKFRIDYKCLLISLEYIKVNYYFT